jgi:uncharacterized lipoprotein YddW (UPF0748 family)
VFVDVAKPGAISVPLAVRTARGQVQAFMRGLGSRLLAAFVLVRLTLGAAPTPPPRELRGMWVATVGNIDWPSKPGLPVDTQKAELRTLLDGARKLNLNTVIFQVRTACDAFYESPTEPWSEYLTGRMGEAPKPAWDPLAYAVEEAHHRGLELHAWFNPFRVRYHQTVSPASQNHVSKTHPEWVRTYGRYLWLDPGEPKAREYSLDVIRDVVRRYDVDGVHIDDYFYPYPEYAPGFVIPIQFPDGAAYSRYHGSGGRLDLADWRRENVNKFVEQLYTAVHEEKAWVKVGISPFGIWRPNVPAGIKGLDAYNLLFADARRWLESGWCDYMAPQLYWAMNKRQQSFEGLLAWWIAQNRSDRLVIPGIASASIGKDRDAADVANQIRAARASNGASGVLFWNASSLRDNLGGVAQGLTRELFSRPALLPETPWLGASGPAAPKLSTDLRADGRRLIVDWNIATNEPARQVLIQARSGQAWAYEIVPPATNHWEFNTLRGDAVPDELWVVGVGRTGTFGEAAVWRRPGAR